MFNEAERVRDQLAEIKEAMAAIDRVLASFGYTSDLDAEMPREERQGLFERGELARGCLNTLRDATGR